MLSGCLSSARLVRFETIGSGGGIRGNVDTIAVVPEHAVVRIEALQLVKIVRFVTESLEEPLEHRR